MSDETLNYDVVIVGGGPSGLASAIRLKQLARDAKGEISVCVLEKGSEIGAHILSGAVIEPRALNELIPNWQDKNAPLTQKALNDKFYYLTKSKAIRLPTPRQMKNHGNYIVSLGAFCKWLSKEATNLNVDIFPGFAASEVLIENDTVVGVKTGEMGVLKDGSNGPQYQPGVKVLAKQTVIAEGCRGSLTQSLFERFNLRDNVAPQTYGIGLKEIWEVEKDKHKPGTVIHTIGWPLDNKTYGGSFVYHSEDKLFLGFVIGLDYQNPYLNPFEELQRFKTHPLLKHLLEDGRRLSYGSKALSEGGYQSIPKLSFPGGVLVGDTAGFLNVPKIKGTHTAMKSGMVAAESVFTALNENQVEANDYQERLHKSWVIKELKKVRNIRPSFQYGLIPALIYSAIDTYLFCNLTPWTLTYKHCDNETLTTKEKANKISYPKHDDKLTFDLASSVYLTNTFHREDEPSHLTLKNKDLAIDLNLAQYDSPETRYCPAGVYEIVYNDNKEPYLQINAQNCIHCKTCDIKDPSLNIVWCTPEGGEGPSYTNM